MATKTNGHKPSRSKSLYKFQLPALKIPSESLTAGTNIPPPPPSPPTLPPKQERAAQPSSQQQANGRPTTPPRTTSSSNNVTNPLKLHPTNSPGAESPASTMPGAFPTSPAATPTPEAQQHHEQQRLGSPATTSNNNSPGQGPRYSNIGNAKRPSSFRKLLSFRSLSNSSISNSTNNNNKSTDNLSLMSNGRPQTPSGNSIMSGTSARPSLSKKRSSMFFGRRRASLAGLLEEDQPTQSSTKLINGGNGESDGHGREPATGSNGIPNGLDHGGLESEKPKPTGPPPPQLPELTKMKSTQGLRNHSGDFLGGVDMFKDIK